MRYWTAALGALALVGCSGGGGGTSSGGGSAATPTPISSPSSTPSPAATYKTYAELTGDQSFKTACAALNFSGGVPPVANPTTGFGDGLTLAYSASANSHTLTGDSHNITYGPAQLDASAPAGVVSYTRVNAGFTERLSIGVPNAGGTGLDYARGFTWRVLRTGATYQYHCILGVPTLSSDLPVSGTVSFGRASINGVAYVQAPAGSLHTFSLTSSTASFSADFVARQVTVSMQLRGVIVPAGDPTVVDLGSFTATIPIDSARPGYTGPLTSTNRDSQFSFLGGSFFGPQAREALAAFEIVSVETATGVRMSAMGALAAGR